MFSTAVVHQSLPVLFLLALFSGSYAWMKQRRIPAWASSIPPWGIDVRQWPGLFLSAIHAEKDNDPLLTPAMQRALSVPRPSTKGRSSAVGDWLAPLIVWFLMITISLAIAGFLLGER